MLKRLASIFMLMAFCAISAYAQGVTTATISGKILDKAGEPLIGATVRAKHVPTGFTAGAISNKTGRFNMVGLRVGGPYEFTVTMVGYEPYSKEGFNLALNQNFFIEVKMNEKGVKTEEIQILADRNQIISSDRTGAAQAVTENEIKNLPTIARSIHDYSRLSPLIMSSTSDGSNVGSRSSKYNNIQVDGAIMGDAFGLSASGTPGGQAGAEPISLDAIQEFQVAVSPFDVRQGGFTGGLINAITRAGTNRYDGSVYGFYRNQDMVGNSPTKDAKGNRAAYPDYNEYTIGGRIGGPIIEDKLFFFANGETKQRKEPQTIGLRGQTGFANVFDVTADTLQLIKDIAKKNYGYDAGSADAYSREVKDMKFFLRFDYNLSEQHRLTLRHNFVNAEQGNAVSRSKTFFAFDGLEYLFKSTQNQTVLQLNSVFGSDMANEFRVAYTSVRDKREPQSSMLFPSVTIKYLGTDKLESVGLGIERYSQQNELNQDILEFTDNFNYFMGDHVFTVGTTNQLVTFSNLFVRDAYGNYEFGSIQDFADGKPSYFSYSYLLDGGKSRAEFSYLQLGAYVQDEWRVLPNLKLTGGVRFDLYTFPDKPSANTKFDSIFAKQTMKYGSYSGLRTEELPTPVAISPRLGFNWDVYDDKSLQVRGGVGIFSGRTPGVWISNQYGNTGMDYGRVDINKNAPPFSADVTKQPLDKNAAVKTTEINITDPNLKMPQLFRLNLAGDFQITEGLIGTLEFIYGKSINDIFYQNINLKDSVNAAGDRMYTIDGRPMYLAKNMISSSYTSVIYMTNTDAGSQYSITAQIQKPYGQGVLPGLSANLAYTYGQAKDVNSATSSQALSNWQYNTTLDPNAAGLTNSLYSIQNRILANVSYSFRYAHGFETSVGLFYEGRSGSPYSFINYTNTKIKWDPLLVDVNIKDANNDNYWSNDLAYIPGAITKQADGTWGDSKMILTNGNDKYFNGKDTITIAAALEAFLLDVDGLKRGQVNERYSLEQPWRHQVDLRLTQVVPIVKGQRMEFTLDVLNVLNLLNSEWGKVKYISNSSKTLFGFEGYDKQTGKIRASYLPNARGNTEDDIFETSDFFSRWQMQLGVRYYF